MRDESGNRNTYPHPCLDALDTRILELMGAGMDDAAIARRSGAGLRTVQRRIRRMMETTGSPSRFAFGVTLSRMGVMGATSFSCAADQSSSRP